MRQEKTFYGLPPKVIFCKRCVMSNQRPTSTAEFTHQRGSKKRTLHIDASGICDACRYAEYKERHINWKIRERELLELLDRYRKDDGSYDCIVPGSGGKDSAYAAHLLKYKYGMHPLTVTWPPILYTDYGYRNYRNWIEIGGFDNITFKPNGRVMKQLTKLSIKNLFHPFQTFILGQKNLAPKIALKYNIPLIFYGENEAEYGNPVADNSQSLRSKSYYAIHNIDRVYLGGVSVPKLIQRYNFTPADIQPFLPVSFQEVEKANIEVRYLGYYIKWIPQESYYYAVEHTGFRARPYRSEGTYSKYNSIDDKIDDLHYFTTYVKFGIGRATYDASQEIRNNHLAREEGVELVKKFDGEFPKRYLEEILDYLGLDKKDFINLSDRFRPPHLWKKNNCRWQLRHTVWGGGADD